jgi:hypothetical protein
MKTSPVPLGTNFDVRPGGGYFTKTGFTQMVCVHVVLLSISCFRCSLGADIRFVPEKGTDHVSEWAHIEINGEIAAGDVEKLQKALADLDKAVEEYARAHQFDQAYRQRMAAVGGPHQYSPPVFLNSRGGSVTVALQMGQILRDSFAWTVVDCNGVCGSSCVFVLAGGVSRDVLCSGRIGLHRPRFEYESFANLSREQARGAYNTVVAACTEFMKQMGVAEQVFSDMLAVPSQEVKFVGRDYGEKTRLLGIDPGWEEWQRARDISYWGEQWVKARDQLLDCYKHGGTDTACRERYEKELRDIEAARRQK